MTTTKENNNQHRKICRSETPEEMLRERLLKAKTLREFRDVLRKFCREDAPDTVWIDVNIIFTEGQVKYKKTLVDELKRIVDLDYLWPRRSLSFNNSYAKFKVIHRLK